MRIFESDKGYETGDEENLITGTSQFFLSNYYYYSSLIKEVKLDGTFNKYGRNKFIHDFDWNSLFGIQQKSKDNMKMNGEKDCEHMEWI